MGVTVIGDAFVDIMVPTYGISRGETHYEDIRVTCGGTATVAIEISRLGEDAKFVGKMGDDAFGVFFREQLRKNKVKDLTFLDDSHPTGLCASLIDKDGERSMVASRGANDYLTISEVESCIGEIEGSRVIYFSGYSLLNISGVARYLMKKLHKCCELWFNPGAPNIINSSFKPLIHDFIDVLILNLAEAKSLTERNEMDEILSELEGLVNLSVITSGKDGCVVLENGESIRAPLNNILEGVDTTGAGDAFSAGFIASKLRGSNNMACARLGQETALNYLERKASIS